MFFLPNKVRVRTYQAGLLQAKAYRALSNYMTSTLAADGISLPEWALLGLLADHHRLRPSDLAEHLGVKPPVVTVQLKRLEAVGYVKRTQLTDDSRTVEIMLTPEGARQVDTTEKRLRLELRAFLKDIKITELVTYIHVLTKLATKI